MIQKRPRVRRNKALARAQLVRASLEGVTFQTAVPRFVCDVFLDGKRVGSYAHDRLGFITWGNDGKPIGRRKLHLSTAIRAIVRRHLETRQ